MQLREASMVDYTFISISEQAITLRFSQLPSKKLRNHIQLMFIQCEALQERNAWITECVPSITGITIYYDAWSVSLLCRQQQTPSTYVREYLATHLHPICEEEQSPQPEAIVVPVCYDDEYGMDLKTVASWVHRSKKEVIKLHSESHYFVQMLGFSPGFPYISGLPECLAMPRLKSPRLAVPQGSIGIADQLTCIYSMDSPGGWHIIGRTPLTLFDPLSDNPFLFKHNHHVVFEPISKKQFQLLNRKINP